MQKIVIFDTALCSANIGDEIIFDAIRSNMADIFDSGISMRLGTHVENFNPLQMLRRNDKVRFCQDADWKFVCGTNLLSQKMIGKINGQWMINPFNASVYSNCILIGVGATKKNENMDSYARYLYRRVLSRDYIHSVRDEQTKRMIESLGLRAINTGCPTLWRFTGKFCDEIPSSKAKNCVLSVSGFANQQNQDLDQSLIDILIDNYNHLWAWIQTIADENYLNTLKGNEKIERIYTLSGYQKLLCSQDVDYIGTRLHGGIFALQHKKRSIIICIDHRARGISATNNIPVIERNDVRERLIDKINSDWKTKIIIDEDAIEVFKNQFKVELET